MRILYRGAVALCLALAWSSGRADDITTTKGESYKGVTVSRAEPDGLVVVTDDGIVKIPFTELPADLQKKYGYDPAVAAQYAQALHASEHAALAKNLQEAQAVQEKNDQDLANADAERKLKEMAANMPSVMAHLKVLSVTDDGVLAIPSVYQVVNTEEIHGETSEPVQKTVLGEEADEPVFVYGVTDAVDGKEVDARIYAAGKYKYDAASGAAKTVEAYAVSPELALKILASKDQ